MIRAGTFVCTLVLMIAPALAAQFPDGGPGSGSVQFLSLTGGGSMLAPVEAGRVPMLRRRISVALSGVPLADALAEIGRLSGVTFAYKSSDLPRDRVTLRAEAMTLAAVLTEALLETRLDVVVSPGERLILVRHGESAIPVLPTGQVTGVVTDSASGLPVDAAEVLQDSLRLRTTTNAVGVFRMTLPVGSHELRIRRIGYRPVKQTVVIEEDQEITIDVKLPAQPTQMQDLVTTATGVRRRYELGNAIATIDADSIVATQPIHSVSDLLETRVPGLIATHTSGAPGDPTRLRLRGLNSVTRSNDPVVIVDGVRVYADQSDVQRSANFAVVNPFDGRPITGRPNSGEDVIQKVATVSPLDQIDPHSIERIEVFKGPSAATLYGADAANGVIVITTKRGQAGPARWTFGSEYGISYQPGKYPESYLRWGHDVATSEVTRCPLVSYNCVVDSLVRYQVLNDKDLTIFGRGHRAAFNMGVSGGASKVTYSLTGSYASETGLIKVPDFEINRYASLTGKSAPGWMKKPQGLTEWGATGHIGVDMGSKAELSFTSQINRSEQRRSDLDQQISLLMGTYADTAGRRFYPGNAVNVGPGSPGGILQVNPTLVGDFRVRTTANATNFTQAGHLTWRPLGWLTTTADVGLNLIDRHDESTQPLTNVDPYNNWSFSFDKSAGFFNVGNGNSTVSTVNLGAVGILPLRREWRLRTALGGNYVRTKTNDLIASGIELIPGATGLEGARKIVTTPQHSEVTTFGWYIEPTLESRRFFLSTGLRLDGADTYGSRQSLAGFPKVSVSYLVSDEPFFPFKKTLSTLRLRAAYGQAGVQPGPADRLRLYQTSPGYFDGTFPPQTTLTNVGNVHLKPERSSEFEGGIDADLLGDKLTVELTAYRKTRRDALVPVELPPSVNGGGTVLINVGRVRNSGFEVSVGTNLIRGSGFSLNTQVHLSKNTNTVLSTGDAGIINGPGNTRVVTGYPLFGVWAKPIVHFADVNNDGIITREEVQLGDKDVFLGPVEPNYEAALYTNMSFARGLVTLSAGFSYTDGQMQVNRTVQESPFTQRALNDPRASLAEQAAAIVATETPYGLSQLVSTFRFNSLAIAFNAPERIAGMFGARTASITIQGTNLGMKTNYRGKDPSVNAYATGNAIADTGQLPLPRFWSFGLRFGL